MKAILGGEPPYDEVLREVARVFGVVTGYSERESHDGESRYVEFTGAFQGRSVSEPDTTIESRCVILGAGVVDAVRAIVDEHGTVEIAYSVYACASEKSISGYRYEWVPAGEAVAAPADVMQRLSDKFATQ